MSLEAQMAKARRARARYLNAKPKPVTVKDVPLTDYKLATWHDYIHSYHLDCLDKLLERVTLHVESKGTDPRGIQNVMISMPRRYGKSTTVESFIQWHLGRNPNDRVMIVSYGSNLPAKMSRTIRNRMRTPQYHQIYPHIQLASDSKSIQNWDLEGFTGGCNAMSINGAATGLGFHVLVVDDPIKNRQEAESQVTRDTTFSELQDSIFNGANTRYAAKIMIGTRWHGDDPIGRFQRQQPEEWVIFKLPALVDEPYQILDHDGGLLYERMPDEPLWDYKHTLEEMKAEEQNAGPYSWASLWQQEPIEARGNIFRREWMMTIPSYSVPELNTVVRAWDLAMSDRDSADFTAGVKVGKDNDGNFYVLDVFHARVDFGNLHDTMLEVMERDGPEVLQGIEKAGYMSRVIESLMADGRTHSYPIMPLTVDKDKLTRALPMTGRFASGKVFLVQSGWNENYIEEMVVFSGKGSAHDDQVDATSAAYALIEDGYIPEGITFW